MQPQTFIFVDAHGDEYKAYVYGESALWGCGKSYDEAVGSLIRNHPERFGLSVSVTEAAQDNLRRAQQASLRRALNK